MAQGAQPVNKPLKNQELHSLTSTIPPYLIPYIATQNTSLYTPIDHAGWRFILKLSIDFFPKHAHEMYLDGLQKTGISTERIPLISCMDEKLQRFGWRAVPVCGFIPPSVFMEFLSLGILPIACDMRQIENLSYTPAPDIVHEAAGHAPIIADPDYAHYLKQYGEISRKAIFSAQDWDVYMAIRTLSDIKENPKTSEAEIQTAQKNLDQALTAVDHISEATQLARMSWWTIEYGLIGKKENPKIYGAGLLSSVGESYNCLQPKVPKIPLTLQCVEMGYDITKPQPQLFITPDFSTLTKVLNELADTMAFRRGGIDSLRTAQKAATVTTTVLDSGLQISGVLKNYTLDSNGMVALLQYEGPVQLASKDQEIKGQGAETHHKGFVTPLGKLKGIKKALFELNENEFCKLPETLIFESGIKMKGCFKKLISVNGQIGAAFYSDCEMQIEGKPILLPNPQKTVIAFGENIISVFGGAADRAPYLAATGGLSQPPGTPKTTLTAQNRRLNALYAEVREIRENKNALNQRSQLEKIYQELERDYQQDWLLRYELIELDRMYQLKAPWTNQALNQLKEISKTSQAISNMVARGLQILGIAF